MFKTLTLATAVLSLAFVAAAEAKPGPGPKNFKKAPVIVKIHPKPYWGHHHHIRPVYVVGRPATVYTRPVVNTCNCLTKDYTQDGQVVFSDLCTKEMASAPVAGAEPKASQAPASNNFAGKTYQDYLAANGQAEKSN